MAPTQGNVDATSKPRPGSPKAGPSQAKGLVRCLTVRPDGMDFRDKMYLPSLVEVPATLELSRYRAAAVPLLDQGQEGACTGFGLSTVAHYLLRSRRHAPDSSSVSPHMLYHMARRYDEWGGEAYEGSSCRGAIKGWFKHGVCAQALWKQSGTQAQVLSEAIETDAANRPLGAYFRVNHKDLIAMHAALAEVGVLYASARVHAGWDSVGSDGHIAFSDRILGGHAFAIVAYDRTGFWIQNSWGADWGHHGFCHIGYDDWLVHGTDVWVARLGVPIDLPQSAGKTDRRAVLAATSAKYSLSELRPHVLSIGHGGAFNSQGDIGTTAASVREILGHDFARITAGWKKKRIVLYAHGGLGSQADALQMLSDLRAPMLAAGCYPLAFIWKTDYWSSLSHMLADATQRRRPEGALDNMKDFMLERLDDALEPLARSMTGKAAWDEVKANALLATSAAQGGARLVAQLLAALVRDADVELHCVAHSAGSILLAPLLHYLTAEGEIRSGPLAAARLKGLGVPVATCTLWAPACTVELFKQCCLPAIQAAKVGHFGMFTLTDKAEQDDNCAHLYNKSLLYLVSHAFEATARIPGIRPDGEAILGMAKSVQADPDLQALFSTANADWTSAPNNEAPGSRKACSARHHGDFDQDTATVQATLARILDKTHFQVTPRFSGTGLSQQARRSFISNAGK